MFCDELSKLPMFENCISGHVSDKTSFRNVITDYWDSIKALFKNLRSLRRQFLMYFSYNEECKKNMVLKWKNVFQIRMTRLQPAEGC